MSGFVFGESAFGLAGFGSGGGIDTATPVYSGVIPAYAYRQYASDENVQAFFSTLNSYQQDILTWFADTPLAVYTSAAISGDLLDWTLTGIYGIARPILTTSSKTETGALGTNVLGTHPLGMLIVTSSGTAIQVTDDIYKRVATWILYRGDGLHFSMPWLLRRVERFLGGINGSDVPLDLSDRPTITVSGVAFSITAPSSNAASAVFEALMQQGYLPTPLPYTFTVTVS